MTVPPSLFSLLKGLVTRVPSILFVQMALHRPRRILDVWWHLGFAACLRKRAARMESAAGWRRKRVRKTGPNLNIGHSCARIGGQNRSQQGPRVRMPWIGKDGARIAGFNNPAQIHDSDFGGQMFDHRQIVADEQITEPKLCAKVDQKIQYLRLHRHIQRRCRFVTDDDLRVQNQRTRYRNSLTLSARKLARIVVIETRWKPNEIHDLSNGFADFRR